LQYISPIKNDFAKYKLDRMKSKRKILLLGIITILAISCNKQGATPIPVARVFDKYLYESDIKSIIKSDVSKEDSILIVKAYIDKWIQTQLLLSEAEKNLSDSQKNVASQLEDYRTSLLIFKYEQALVNQKIDTSVNFQEIENYYNSNKENFVLNETMVKALFIKLRKEAPQNQKIKELYRSNKDEDVKTLDNLAYQAAIKYDFFNDQWIPLSFILKQMPYSPEIDEKEILKKRYIEMEDGDFLYLVSFRDVLNQGEIAPMEIVTDELKSIILNSRKQKFIQDIEQKIYDKAGNEGNIDIYENKKSQKK